jgi:hypothetical protein
MITFWGINAKDYTVIKLWSHGIPCNFYKMGECCMLCESIPLPKHVYRISIKFMLPSARYYCDSVLHLAVFQCTHVSLKKYKQLLLCKFHFLIINMIVQQSRYFHSIKWLLSPNQIHVLHLLCVTIHRSRGVSFLTCSRMSEWEVKPLKPTLTNSRQRHFCWFSSASAQHSKRTCRHQYLSHVWWAPKNPRRAMDSDCQPSGSSAPHHRAPPAHGPPQTSSGSKPRFPGHICAQRPREVHARLPLSGHNVPGFGAPLQQQLLVHGRPVTVSSWPTSSMGLPARTTPSTRQPMQPRL